MVNIPVAEEQHCETQHHYSPEILPCYQSMIRNDFSTSLTLLTVLWIQIKMHNVSISCRENSRDVLCQVRTISRLLAWSRLVPWWPGHRYTLVDYCYVATPLA